MDLSNFKSTQFVSQYAGLPVDEFLQSASALQQRGQQNQEKLDQLELMANNIQTMDIDENVKQSRLAEIDKQMTALAESGAYEHAAAQVRTQARDFARDEELMDASANYSKLQKMKAEAKAQGATQIQLQYLDNAIASYNRGGGAAGGSDLAEVSFYKEANLAKEVDIILNGQKANKTIISAPDGSGFINTKTNERVTEADLRKQAVAYLSGDPKFSRQIEDMAKLNIYNTTLSSTNDAEAAMATYESADAATLDTEIGGVIDRLITPAVDKYSYRISGNQLSSDTRFSGMGTRAGKGSIPISFKSDMVDLGNIPNNAKEFRTEQDKIKGNIKNLQNSINIAVQNGNEKEAKLLRNQLAQAQTTKSALDKSYSKYVAGVQDPTVRVGATIRRGIESGLFNTEGQTRAEQILNLQADPRFREWAKDYGVSTEDIDQQFAFADRANQPEAVSISSINSKAVSIYNKGKDDRWFDAGSDFESYLEDRGQTTQPQLYSIDNKDLRGRATEALQEGTVKIFHQGTTGEVIKDAETLQRLPYEVVGVSAMTAEGTLYAVKLPDDMNTDKGKQTYDVSDKFAKQYNGQIVYMRPVESNMDQVIGEELFNEVMGASGNTRGGAMAQFGASTFAKMVGTPSQFADDIALLGTSDARGNSTSLIDPGTNKPFADVTQNQNGFYTINFTFPDGSTRQVKELQGAAEATSKVDEMYNEFISKD